MADVTLRLIWYRLGELRENMEELYQHAQTFYAEFSWRQVDIVDLLVVFWIIFGITVAILAQLYNKFFGGRRLTSSNDVRNLKTSPRKRVPVGPVESCQWLNSVINWVYLNYNCTPEYVNAWLRGLNDQTKKDGSLQIRFDRILAGSLPPRITNINTEAGPKDNFTLRGSLEASELGFQILVSDQTASSVQLTNCDINVQVLKGELNVQSVLQKEDVHVFVRFDGEPEVVLLIKPHPKSESDPQTRKELEAKIDVPEVDKMVKRCLAQAITHFKLHASQFDTEVHMQLLNHLLHAPAKPPRTPEALLRQDKRLLVKVIKASGLGAKDMGCNDPYCTVEMDAPAQRHTTSVVRNAVNPFWDESFLFDLLPHSRELVFEVYDKDRPTGENFLGMAVAYVEELKKQPSSRHIIPLAGRQPNTGKGGNITVEFLFMDPAELPGDMNQDERDLMLATAANLSPRRRVETQRTFMPGGMIVTTQTAAGPHDSVFDDTLVSEQYHSTSGRSPTDSSPRVPRHAGSRSSTMPNRYHQLEQTQARPLILIIQDGANRQIPEIKMTGSTPTDDHVDGRASSASSDRSNKAKRSSSLASTLRKRFNKVRKPRSHSADRAPPRESDHLRPNDQYASGSKSTDDVEDPDPNTNLKKSKSLGSSLKKLFKGKKHKSKSGLNGERSRDSSVNRSRERLTPEQQQQQQQQQPQQQGSHPASTNDDYYYHKESPSPVPRRQQKPHSRAEDRISQSSAV